VRDLRAVVAALAEASDEAGAKACVDDRLQIAAPLAGKAVPGGETYPVVGTADHPDARRYYLEVRPAGAENWSAIGDFRRDRVAAQLGQWNTAGYGPGFYELQLRATGRSDTALPGATCTILVEITR
jgi:hypothetical protein